MPRWACLYQRTACGKELVLCSRGHPRVRTHVGRKDGKPLYPPSYPPPRVLPLLQPLFTMDKRRPSATFQVKFQPCKLYYEPIKITS